MTRKIYALGMLVICSCSGCVAPNQVKSFGLSLQERESMAYAFDMIEHEAMTLRWAENYAGTTPPGDETDPEKFGKQKRAEALADVINVLERKTSEYSRARRRTMTFPDPTIDKRR